MAEHVVSYQLWMIQFWTLRSDFRENVGVNPRPRPLHVDQRAESQSGRGVCWWGCLSIWHNWHLWLVTLFPFVHYAWCREYIQTHHIRWYLLTFDETKFASTTIQSGINEKMRKSCLIPTPSNVPNSNIAIPYISVGLRMNYKARARAREKPGSKTTNK